MIIYSNSLSYSFDFLLSSLLQNKNIISFSSCAIVNLQRKISQNFCIEMFFKRTKLSPLYKNSHFIQLFTADFRRKARIPRVWTAVRLIQERDTLDYHKNGSKYSHLPVTTSFNVIRSLLALNLQLSSVFSSFKVLLYVSNMDNNNKIELN